MLLRLPGLSSEGFGTACVAKRTESVGPVRPGRRQGCGSMRRPVARPGGQRAPAGPGIRHERRDRRHAASPVRLPCRRSTRN
ncbi:hypothetical protein LP419_39015 [Massilia sp. H-1]|nr:hypothetical protein LP419_39015 [Massilia sp. H-1]